jgi:hypothetical protein
MQARLVEGPRRVGVVRRPVWATAAGERNVAIGHPTADNALEFTFRRGDPVCKRLVSTPGLRA